MNFEKDRCCWKIVGSAEDYRQSKVRQEVIELIRDNGGKMELNKIMEELGIAQKEASTLRGRLAEMVKKNQLKRSGRGIYELIKYKKIYKKRIL